MEGKVFSLDMLCCRWLCPLKEGEDNSKVEPNKLKSNNNLVKVMVVLEVFGHAESKSGLYFGLSLFLREVLVIPFWKS